jgi:hypothetical protein
MADRSSRNGSDEFYLPLQKQDYTRAALEQVNDAGALLSRPLHEYVPWPFENLRKLLGPVIVPGDLWMVAAFSGGGKTTALTSLAHEWLLSGVGVYYLGLESRAKIIRLMFSCLRLGINYNDVLDGTAKAQSNWDDLHQRIFRDSHHVALGVQDGTYPLAVATQSHLQSRDLPGIFEEAANLGSKVVIVDHIDHLAIGDTTDLYLESRKAVNALLALAHEYDIAVIIATQTNNDQVRGDRLAQFHPPQPQHIFMGSHKRFVVAGCVGLYRPLRANLSREELRAVRDDEADVHSVLEPDQMGVSCMKHRYKNREGLRERLRVADGRVFDLSERDRYVTGGYR